MKTALLFGLSLLFAATALPEISLKTDSARSTMSIEGTSTLHDWTMLAENLTGTMEVDIYKDRIHIEDLRLEVPVKSLKSGKSKMDDNAYKALKADRHKIIKYQFSSVKNQKAISETVFELTTVGQLTVAGKTRSLQIPVKATKTANGLQIQGSTAFKMSSFGVEPPSFMMGAVSTGDLITINFSINYN